MDQTIGLLVNQENKENKETLERILSFITRRKVHQIQIYPKNPNDYTCVNIGLGLSKGEEINFSTEGNVHEQRQILERMLKEHNIGFDVDDSTGYSVQFYIRTF